MAKSKHAGSFWILIYRQDEDDPQCIICPNEDLKKAKQDEDIKNEDIYLEHEIRPDWTPNAPPAMPYYPMHFVASIYSMCQISDNSDAMSSLEALILQLWKETTSWGA